VAGEEEEELLTAGAEEEVREVVVGEQPVGLAPL
jgi:hypothetical protein